MKRFKSQVFLVGAIFFALVVMVGCGNDNGSTGGSGNGGYLEIYDPLGFTVMIPAEVEAIMPLTPAVTGILIDLGLADYIVATDTNSAFMFAELGDLPAFDMFSFDVESLIELDPDLVIEAIKGGLAGSTVMNAKAPMMIAGNYKPGFRIELHIKDLTNALETGHRTASPLPLTSAVMEMFQALRVDGAGDDDHSALAKYYEKLSGEKIS